jgi:hypothetical protein
VIVRSLICFVAHFLENGEVSIECATKCGIKVTKAVGACPSSRFRGPLSQTLSRTLSEWRPISIKFAVKFALGQALVKLAARSLACAMVWHDHRAGSILSLRPTQVAQVLQQPADPVACDEEDDAQHQHV